MTRQAMTEIHRIEPNDDAPLMQLIAEMREARDLFVEQLCSWPSDQLRPFTGLTQFFYTPRND